MRRHDPRPHLIVKPPRPQRYRRGKGRGYVADVVEKVRVLLTGTTWPEDEIAERVGIGVATVHGWKIARGWQRPDGASTSTRKVGVVRSGLTHRCRGALRTIESRAAAEVLRLCAEPAPDRRLLNQAVAIVLQTRHALRTAPKPCRASMQRLEDLASREIDRLGHDPADTAALERARDLVQFAQNALYRIPWRPKEV